MDCQVKSVTVLIFGFTVVNKLILQNYPTINIITLFTYSIHSINKYNCKDKIRKKKQLMSSWSLK